MKFSTALTVAAIVGIAQAYSASEADCKKFAELWDGNCAGTDDDQAYSTSDW